MRSSAITMVLGMCGVLSFGCAEVQKVEKEASGVAKEAEKSGAMKDVEKAVEKKVEGKSEDKKVEAKADAKAESGADEKAVKEAISAHNGSGVTASVKGGVVVLSGKVGTAKDRADIEAALKGVKGVTKVEGDVKVGK